MSKSDASVGRILVTRWRMGVLAGSEETAAVCPEASWVSEQQDTEECKEEYPGHHKRHIVGEKLGFAWGTDLDKLNRLWPQMARAPGPPISGPANLHPSFSFQPERLQNPLTLHTPTRWCFPWQEVQSYLIIPEEMMFKCGKNPVTYFKNEQRKTQQLWLKKGENICHGWAL